MQAVAAVEDRGADTPDAIVDFAQADGVALVANVDEALAIRLIALGIHAQPLKNCLAALGLHMRQQHPRRGADQQRLGQAFLIAAAQRLHAVVQLDANGLAIARHHQGHALLADIGQALELRLGNRHQQRFAIELLRQLQAGRARQITAVAVVFGQPPAQQGLQMPIGTAQRLLQLQAQLLGRQGIFGLAEGDENL
ncbi:hypothetical protein D3C77_349760 [compost metagenome]